MFIPRSQCIIQIIDRHVCKFHDCCGAGLVRLCSVKTIEYQEHASEYGVHWNFFLTVAAVSTVMALVPIPQSYSLAAGNWL